MKFKKKKINLTFDKKEENRNELIRIFKLII